MDWSDVAQHLTGFAHVATATADGEPHVSVVMPCVEDDTIWIFTFASSGKARRIAANGRVAMMWRPGAEAYVYGTAAIVDDVAEKQRLWARPDLPFDPSMFFGSVDNPDHVLVKVTPTRATLMVEGEGGGIRQLNWRRPAG
jgi:general stress protein 26